MCAQMGLHRLGSSVEVALDSEISEAKARVCVCPRPSAGCAPAARQTWGAGLQDSFCSASCRDGSLGLAFELANCSRTLLSKCGIFSGFGVDEVRAFMPTC